MRLFSRFLLVFLVVSSLSSAIEIELGGPDEPCGRAIVLPPEIQWSQWEDRPDLVANLSFVTHTDRPKNPDEFPALVAMGAYLGRVSRVVNAQGQTQAGSYELRIEGEPSQQWLYFVPRETGAPAVKVGWRIPSGEPGSPIRGASGEHTILVDSVEMVPGVNVRERHEADSTRTKQWALVLPTP